MSSAGLSAVLGNSVPGHTFDHNGKTYTLRYIDQAMKDAFQKHLFAQARIAAGELRSLMTPEEFAKRLDQLNSDFVLGEYAIESKLGIRFLSSQTGWIWLASHIIGCEFGEVVVLLKDRGAEIAALIQLVIAESMPGVSFKKNESDSDPNAEAPASNG